ncbi:MAG: XRE family transcriptional regulator [Lachnospiraceae bacterium]|nr:XRE family transcriptional regulator [Lachnospiraceae bacterium]
MNDNDQIINILNKLKDEQELSISELARRVGMAKSAVSRYFNKTRQFPLNRAHDFAAALNTTTEYILGIDDAKSKSKKTKGVTIPVLGEVAADIPIEAIEDIIDYEEISKDMSHTGDFFGLRIKGDSMSPRISEGDVVIVRQQNDAESGDIVIVLIDGESATCKRLMKYKDGISLISFNPMYNPMTFSNDEIESKPIKIIGKVVENRQKY